MWDFNSVLPIEEQTPSLLELTVIPDVIEYMMETKKANFRVKLLRQLAKDDFNMDLIKLMSDQEFLITWGYGLVMNKELQMPDVDDIGLANFKFNVDQRLIDLRKE